MDDFCCDRYGEDCGRRTLAFLTVVVERKRMVSMGFTKRVVKQFEDEDLL